MMNSINDSLAEYHAFLILLTPYQTFEKIANDPQLEFIENSISLILKGYSNKLVQQYSSKNFFQNISKIDINLTTEKQGLLQQLSHLVDDLFSNVSSYVNNDPIYENINESQKSEIIKNILLLLAIALGQCFVQLNFTGPSISNISEIITFFINSDQSCQKHFLDALELQGLTPYQLCDTPALLVLSLAIFEHLQGLHIIDPQDLHNNNHLSVEEYTNKTENFIDDSVFPNNYNNCSVALVASCWWRSRFLQIQQSLFFQNSSILSSITSVLLNVKILEFFILNTSNEKNNALLEQQLAITFNLENSRNSYHAELENLTINFLENSKKLSKFLFILTGALAKLTKYQEKSTASLVILAKSDLQKLLTDEKQSENNENLIETHQLNSDLLLEVPTYEKLDNQVVNDFLARDNLTTTGDLFKKIKLSNFKELNENRDYEDSRLSKQQKLLPIAMNFDKIPNDLKSLNPNDQPFLNDLDSAQLLLTVLTIKQTSPSGNHLVEEELSALISRIIANNSSNNQITNHPVNWLIFSKSLWERSLIESNKAKTIERGIFQMQALIEELNSKIQTRLFTTTSDSQNDEEKEVCSSAERLRYLNVIPLAPRWDLEVKLAQKFMTLGIMKSALEIFDRLEMVAETALCYASFGDASKAEKILRQRIIDHPNDARSISILGDLTADPELWEKAWSLSKYQNAKVSLSKYYYSKKTQDTKKFMALAMDHIYDVLQINPLSFSNWYYYGCLALESSNFEIAAEAFTRCVSLDDTHSHSWSNLGTSLLNLDKSKEALNAFLNAIKTSDATNWRIWENYQMAAVRAGDWIQVIRASKTLIGFKNDEKSINLKIVNALANQLVLEPFKDDEASLTFFQRSTIDYICNEIPKVITKNSQLWKIQSKVELWRKKPWNSLGCMEKAFRIELNNEKISYDESAWNLAVESCLDLLASYESLGGLPGKHGADDLVCKDWKFKARSSVRSLMGKGKLTWSDSDGWNRLVEAKQDL